MRERLGGASALRITLVATLVTGIAVFLASSWVVDTVRESMTDRLHSTASDQLAAVRGALEAGRDPREIDLAHAGPRRLRAGDRPQDGHG